jgi:type IV secretion system protein TrbB
VTALAEPEYNVRVSRARADLFDCVSGPIADGLADPCVTEVIVDANGQVSWDYYDRGIVAVPGAIMRPDDVEYIITTIASWLDRHLEIRATGMLEGEVPFDGSRIQGMLRCVSPMGPVLAIRKRRQAGVEGWPAPTLDSYGMSDKFREAIDQTILGGDSILIVGGTSSGKSTMGTAYLEQIVELCPGDRIITIEDAAELSCTAKSWTALHTYKEVQQDQLVRAAMRLRPDRLVVGEVRGKAKAMLSALSSGHPGFTTIHGGSIQQGLTRVLDFTASEGGVPPRFVSDTFSYALLMKRNRITGQREVAELHKVDGYSNADGYLTTPL